MFGIQSFKGCKLFGINVFENSQVKPSSINKDAFALNLVQSGGIKIFIR